MFILHFFDLSIVQAYIFTCVIYKIQIFDTNFGIAC